MEGEIMKRKLLIPVLLIPILLIASYFSIYYIVNRFLTKSEAFKYACTFIRSNPVVLDHLGTIAESTDAFAVNGGTLGSKIANFTIHVKGTKSEGEIAIVEKKIIPNKWTIIEAKFLSEDGKTYCLYEQQKCEGTPLWSPISGFIWKIDQNARSLLVAHDDKEPAITLILDDSTVITGSAGGTLSFSDLKHRDYVHVWPKNKIEGTLDKSNPVEALVVVVVN
jgi:hypothetical protein